MQHPAHGGDGGASDRSRFAYPSIRCQCVSGYGRCPNGCATSCRATGRCSTWCCVSSRGSSSNACTNTAPVRRRWKGQACAPPRTHRYRDFGVLAAHSPLRASVTATAASAPQASAQTGPTGASVGPPGVAPEGHPSVHPAACGPSDRMNAATAIACAHAACTATAETGTRSDHTSFLDAGLLVVCCTSPIASVVVYWCVEYAT